ncbi:hypothetical protein P7K49_009275 [Saguinus oedipus]|uniref:Uncharacterized protein n=1 Tax=Saguinus oedipus TaxID=9490 RepID=A0ABQ9VJI0_SAGOE|nr:hypothetical protein P7K49_009275 [Saguinus oedipus]
MCVPAHVHVCLSSQPALPCPPNLPLGNLVTPDTIPVQSNGESSVEKIKRKAFSPNTSFYPSHQGIASCYLDLKVWFTMKIPRTKIPPSKRKSNQLEQIRFSIAAGKAGKMQKEDRAKGLEREEQVLVSSQRNSLYSLSSGVD